MLKKLLPFMRKYRLPALLCPLVMILEVIADVLMPRLMAAIVDQGIARQDIGFIVRTGVAMIGLALAALVFGILGSRLGSLASQGFGAEIRDSLFAKIQSFSFAHLDKFGVPSLITRITSDVNNLQQTAMMVLRMMFRAPSMLILALIMAISINGQLALVFLAAIPLLTLFLILIMRQAMPRFKILQQKLDELNSAVQENLIGIRVVKAFVRSDFEKDRFFQANNNLRKRALHAIRLVILNQPIMMLILYACIIAIIWFGGGMVQAGTLQTGELISFITYVNQIMMSTMMLSMLFLMFTRAKASADRVLEVLDTGSGMEDHPESTLRVENGDVAFRKVSFRYASEATQNTLSDIDFDIRSGETIGIIGATGSAKTSLVQLIPRLYDVLDGQVLVAGHDVRDYALPTLRDAVAVVLQNNTLFSGTIRDNLLWGKPDASDEDLMLVCRIAQAAEFIETMLAGLDTKLGQGGVNLSGGQKQRLCIARALLKKPRILILDDSTSAVDTATDARLREELAAHLPDITVIIIAQRIVSIKDADRILVLDDGRVTGIGAHDALMNDNEIYRDVYLSQQEGVMTR